MTQKHKVSFSCIVFLLVVGLASIPATAQQENPGKRPWKSEDEFRIKTISDLQISPDDKHLAFVVTERNLSKNRTYSSIWTLPLEGGKPFALADTTGNSRSPRWSPDGTKLAYFSTIKGVQGLYTMNADGSNKTKLTEFETSNAYIGWGTVGNALCWSPDGKKIAYNAAGPRHYSNIPSPQNPPNENDVMVIDRLLHKSFYYYSDMRRTYVWVIPVEGGKPEQISFGEYDYHSLSWSPDGKRIVCVSNRTGKDDFNANNDICLLSPEKKEMIQLTHTIGPEYFPLFSPDGTKIAFQGRTRDRRSKESDAELHKVYVMSSKGGSAIDLSAPLDRWCMSHKWDSNSKNVHFTALISGKVNLFSAPVEGGKVSPRVDKKGRISAFALANNGDIYFVFSDFTHPPEIYRVEANGKEKTKLTSFNDALMTEVDILESERFVFNSFDGRPIEGWIMKPCHFKKGKKYPMILSVHGGPHAMYGYSLRSPAKFQLYAAHGYVVVFMNPRGSTGYGQEFSDLCVGDLGGGDYKDLMTGVDYVLERYDFIDSDRMGVTGVSYGGYMSNWIITHTQRFKAAVPISSISNLISHWGTNCNTLWFESDMGFMPFEDYDRAWSASPLKYVKQCKTPTLFISGVWDFCTDVGQAEQMFTALKKLGVDSVMAHYPNEGHGVFNQPKHTHDYYLRSLAWFDKYLK